ncbi:MAG: Rpn family recombination-promoting nuclease/putative transposase [Caloramator sp.]|nr:Rpn family recombination-promoting nuclease/putative transposase [Caloramator sp.]
MLKNQKNEEVINIQIDNTEIAYDENFLIPPKFDFVFKHIFGDVKHKRALISFLNSVLEIPKEDLEGLEILNPELTKSFKEDKKGILDVRVRTKDKKEIDIEVQILQSSFMPERTLFYWGKMFTQQIEAGQDYTKLNKCITINIVDFNVTPIKRLSSTYHIFEDETKFKLTDALEIHFLELKKLYDKEVPRDENDPLVMWMEFIDGNREVIDMLSKKNEDINYAYDILKIISKSKEARMAYESEMAALRDEKTRLIEAEEKGKNEGRIEGKREVAERMLKKGLNVQTVAELVDISIEEVEEIIKKLIQ